MNKITIRPFLAAKLCLFALGALFALSSCDGFGIRGNGHVLTDARKIPEVSSVEAHGALRVEWHSGPPSVTVTTDDNLMGYVDVRVDGRKLVLRTHNNLRPTNGVVVRVSSANLASVALHGAVRLVAENLAANDFYIDGSGATHIELSGTASSLNATLSGASRLEAESLRSQTVDMSISGAGRAEVYASENLRVRISGAGKVYYSGNPKSVERKISGAGKIKART